MGVVTLDLVPRGSVSIETLVNGPIQTNSYAVISNNECLIVDPACGPPLAMLHYMSWAPRM